MCLLAVTHMDGLKPGARKGISEVASVCRAWKYVDSFVFPKSLYSSARSCPLLVGTALWAVGSLLASNIECALMLLSCWFCICQNCCCIRS